mmetsp:Transcript_111964/g.317009  ORF Transcript_111964/g.317009 Transcript_111964/m.317009 type:complete len:397 (+) Transcript_111964:740-1930(+)
MGDHEAREVAAVLLEFAVGPEEAGAARYSVPHATLLGRSQERAVGHRRWPVPGLLHGADVYVDDGERPHARVSLEDHAPVVRLREGRHVAVEETVHDALRLEVDLRQGRPGEQGQGQRATLVVGGLAVPQAVPPHLVVKIRPLVPHDGLATEVEDAHLVNLRHGPRRLLHVRGRGLRWLPRRLGRRLRGGVGERRGPHLLLLPIGGFPAPPPLLALLGGELLPLGTSVLELGSDLLGLPPGAKLAQRVALAVQRLQIGRLVDEHLIAVANDVAPLLQLLVAEGEVQEKRDAQLQDLGVVGPFRRRLRLTLRLLGRQPQRVERLDPAVHGLRDGPAAGELLVPLILELHCLVVARIRLGLLLRLRRPLPLRAGGLLPEGNLLSPHGEFLPTARASGA